MATFTFAAKDSSGKTVSGTIQAADRSEAVNQLRGRDLIILKLEEGGKAAKAPKAEGTGSGLGTVRRGGLLPSFGGAKASTIVGGRQSESAGAANAPRAETATSSCWGSCNRTDYRRSLR